MNELPPALVFVDGVRAPDAKMSVFDRGSLYGDAVFEVLRTYGGRIADADAHLARLGRSAQALGFSLPAAPADLAEELSRAAESAQREGLGPELYLRLSVSRGIGLGLDPRFSDHPHRLLIITTLRPIDAEVVRAGVGLFVVDGVVPREQLGAEGAKIVGYLRHILALGRAREVGAAEPLFVDGAQVIEGGSSCVLSVRGNTLRAPLDSRGLAGITRARLVELAPSLGLAVDSSPMELPELLSADEVMIASTIREVVGVARVHHLGTEHVIGAGLPGRWSTTLRQALGRYHLRKIGHG